MLRLAFGASSGAPSSVVSSFTLAMRPSLAFAFGLLISLHQFVISGNRCMAAPNSSVSAPSLSAVELQVASTPLHALLRCPGACRDDSFPPMSARLVPVATPLRHRHLPAPR